MVKKRGGRRGKANKAENQVPEEEQVETPSTSVEKSELECKPEAKQPIGAWSKESRTEEKPLKRDNQPIEKVLESSIVSVSGTSRGRGRGIPQRQHDDFPQPGRSARKSEWGASGRSDNQQAVVVTKDQGGDIGSWGGAKPKRPVVTQLEGDTASKSEQSQIQSTTPSVSLRFESKDYKPGTRGLPIRIETNHMRLNLGNLKTIYRYDVSIEPEKKPKKMLRQVFELFRVENFPNNHPAYDGQKLAISAKKLPLKNDMMSSTITITTDRNEQIAFKMTIKLTGTVDLSQINNLLQKKNIEEIYQCIEIVLKQAYVNSFLNVGRRFYTAPSRNEYNLGCGSEMYLGGYQAVVQGCVPFLNVDVAHKAFTTAISLPDLIIEMFSTKFKPLAYQDLKNIDLQRWQLEQLNDYLKNLKVIYQIPTHPGSKKLYKINGLANKANLEKFENEGQQTTVELYFKNKWHSPLKFPNLPTLWVGAQNKRICVPIEMCILKEGQPLEGSRLLGKQTSKMIGYSATPTYERKKKIENIMTKANHNSNKSLQEFNFSVNQDFEKLNARVLEVPTLQYLDNKVKPKNGVWRAGKFQNGVQIRKWTVIGFGLNYERTKNDINDLVKKIIDFGTSCNMFFDKAEAPFEFIRSDPRLLKTALEKRKNYDLVIVIFMENNKDSYYMIKQEAEQRIGLLTQCLKSSTLQKLNESTVRNILLKINVKMNGTNHIVDKFDLISKVPTLVMGADVTHPSPQAKTIPSVVAVTASHDLTATKYNDSSYVQKPRETFSEIIQQLEAITISKLQYFKKQTQKLPERIYFLRDGVSDGEFERVIQREVAAIKSACLKFKPNYNPKLTFLVVQKRHHTRFFPTDKASTADNDRNKNVPVGTCVDTVITDPTIQSFYLLSHQSIKGVGRPTKYCVLYDENNLTNDDVEMLTYYLCHVYTRCNRSVSYPAPTYFAHLAAERHKVYLYKKNLDLNNLDQKLVEIQPNLANNNPMYFS